MSRSRYSLGVARGPDGDGIDHPADSDGYFGVLLDFFGETFSYESAARQDIAHVSLIFREFVRLGTRACSVSGRFRLSNDAGLPLIEDLVAHNCRHRSIQYLAGDSWETWRSEHTPIPPLTAGPLAGRYVVLHGSCLAVAGAAVCAVGPSFAGKSALLLECVHRGLPAVSDDLVVLGGLPDWPSVQRYPKPVGIRDPTRKLLPWLGERLGEMDEKLTLSFPARDGRPATTLAHLSDVMATNPFVAEERLPLSRVAILDRSAAGVSAIRPAEAVARLLPNVCYSGLDRRAVASSLAALVAQVPVHVLGNENVALAADLVARPV